MASVPDYADAPGDVLRLNRETVRLEAEARKLFAEAAKLNAERQKLTAGERKLARDAMLSPWLLLAQGMIAGAARLGAGAALTKLIVSH